MKHLLLAAIISAVAMAPAVADAQSRRDGGHQQQRHDRGPAHRGQAQRQQPAHVQRNHRGPAHRGPAHRGPAHRAPAHRAPVRYVQPRPVYRPVTVVRHVPAPAHHYTRWQRGQHLPSQYRGSQYVVDHRHHRFAAPPPGHRYVRINGDAVLVGVATGVIAAVLLNAFN